MDDEYWRFRRASPLRKGVKTLVMGIVNLTPDSFSGGGAQAPEPEEAAQRALRLIGEGADIIDFGAESTRPGAKSIGWREEAARLGEAVRLVAAKTDKPLSVDTYHPETARLALEQGADMINDVTALRGGWSPEAGLEGMAELAAGEGAHVILMHMPAPPDVMQTAPAYADVVGEISAFLLERTAVARRHGVPDGNIWLDPGIGFGKNFSHNRELLARLDEIVAAGYPVAVGLSRKRLIQDALGLPVAERLEASLALAVLAVRSGAALVRVHDVKATARAVGMADAILKVLAK